MHFEQTCTARLFCRCDFLVIEHLTILMKSNLSNNINHEADVISRLTFHFNRNIYELSFSNCSVNPSTFPLSFDKVREMPGRNRFSTFF